MRRRRSTRCRRTATTRRWSKATRPRASGPIRRPARTAPRPTVDSAFCIKVETHNHPTAIAPFPGASHRRRRRDPRRGRDRPRRQAEGRPDRLLGVAPAHPDAAAAVGRRRARSTRAWRRRWRSCSTARSAPPRSTTNSAGRTWPAISAASSCAEGDGTDPRLRQADHAGRRPRRDRPRPGREARPAARRRGGRARRPGDADRPGRRRRQFGGLGRERRGPRFRQRAARQPGDGAALPGSHRPLRRAGRRQPDPLVRTTSAPAACPTRFPSCCTTPAWAA